MYSVDGQQEHFCSRGRFLNYISQKSIRIAHRIQEVPCGCQANFVVKVRFEISL